MMNPNNMNGAEDQQVKQLQQQFSNKVQMNIPGQKVAAIEGAQRVAGLSAAQIANQQKSGHIAMAILASKGEDSEMARMSDPNYAAAKMASVAQQSRLKGLA